MGIQLFTNNADTTLSGSLPNSGTTMVLYAGAGAKFPNPSGGDYFLLTLFEKDLSNNETNIEVVKVTARTSDTLTIVRDFENTIGVAGGFSYPSSPGGTVYCSLRWTAGGAGNMVQDADIGVTVQAYDADLDWVSSNITAAGKALLDDADAAAQRATLGLVIGTDVQAPLVSGTSLKTINSTTLLGSGDIAITGNATHTGDATGDTAITVVALNGTNLAGLATGLLKNTTSTGVPSIAAAGTDYEAPGTASTATASRTFQAALIETPVVANTGTAYTVTDRSLHGLTLTGNCTFTFPTNTTGKQFTLLLKQDGTGSRTITWPSAVRWAAGTAPTITATASKTDVISFIADGTYWLGFVGGQNYTRA